MNPLPIPSPTLPPLPVGVAYAQQHYNRMVAAPDPGVTLIEPLHVPTPSWVEDPAGFMTQPVASELVSLRDRYLKITGFEAESIVRFEANGPNGYFTACINPVVVATGRFVGGDIRIFLGMVKDSFNIHQLQNAENSR